MKNMANTMIVIVIIGLLAATAIPAFKAAHEHALVEKYKQGYTLTDKEKEIVARRLATQQSYGTVTVGGKQYYLFPKDTSFNEIHINGVDYILVPAH